MNIVSEIWTWQEGDRIYSRLTTNVCTRGLLARLTKVGLLDSAETVHAYFGDRAEGGSGYEILWKRCVSFEELRKALVKV